MPDSLKSSIVQNVRSVLTSDGFEKPLGGMQIRPSGKEWRSWISIRSEGSVDIKVGVFSVVIRDAMYDVINSHLPLPYGKAKKYRVGPPNIMLPLSFLIDPDPRAQNKMPWADIAGKDPEWVQAQIIDAIRNYAYPFFIRTFNYETLLDAAMKYGTLNQAQQYSTPILMLLGGRRSAFRDFTELCLSHQSGTVADDYRRYIAALEPYLVGKGLLRS